MMIRDLTILECTKFLDANRFGHLSCASNAGQPYVVPIYFAHADNRLYTFSMPGKKVDLMRENHRVCMVAEEHPGGKLWKSVVVEGTSEELPDEVGHKRDRERAWSLLSRYADWWEPGALKPGDTFGFKPFTPYLF
jgi:nitroimidazol reductase NimA-like FMN-containing flavoprotein (pyridoxamine 5'-phosphate oxidase superfamily)